VTEIAVASSKCGFTNIAASLQRDIDKVFQIGIEAGFWLLTLSQLEEK
jgi:hypothetical protein